MRSVTGLSHLSTFWDKRPKKLSTLESFAVLLEPKDRMISFDLKGGYHRFELHPQMHKYKVLVMLGERYFQYMSLPFGWRHSYYLFTTFTSRLWSYLKSKYRYRILDYIDDVLVCPYGPGSSRIKHCVQA